VGGRAQGVASELDRPAPPPPCHHSQSRACRARPAPAKRWSPPTDTRTREPPLYPASPPCLRGDRAPAGGGVRHASCERATETVEEEEEWPRGSLAAASKLLPWSVIAGGPMAPTRAFVPARPASAPPGSGGPRSRAAQRGLSSAAAAEPPRRLACLSVLHPPAQLAWVAAAAAAASYHVCP
jgi:hypothetical protein